MINQCTKFEVCRFTRYEAINGSAKCRKWGGLEWLGALKVMGNATIRYNAYDFLFDFNRNYVYIMMKNTTILSQGQLQLRKMLRLGTWNIRSTVCCSLEKFNYSVTR